MLTRLAKVGLIGGGICCALSLAGCLPEDALQALSFSPDGQLLALVYEKRGLVVADPAELEWHTLAPAPVETRPPAWLPDGRGIAFSTERFGSADVLLASLDRETTGVAMRPSRETSPMLTSSTLIYLDTDTGVASLTTASLYGNGRDSADAPLPLPVLEGDVYDPVLSPGKRYLAWTMVEQLCPQVFLLDLQSGDVAQLTSETEPLGLLPGTLTWMPDESAVAYLRNAPEKLPGSDETATDDASAGITGTDLCVKKLDATAGEERWLHRDKGISSVALLAQGRALFIEGGKLQRFDSGKVNALELDFDADLPTVSATGEVAFAAAGQLVGLTSSSLERARVLTFELQDKFLLAEEYFRSGLENKSYDLYRELATAVQRTRDPEMMRFVTIANLRRLGQTKQAVAEMEHLLNDEASAIKVPRQYLWRLLGFSYLLELDNPTSAAMAFRRYEELTTATRAAEGPDSAINALEIIEQTSAPVVQLYGRAIKARLEGDFPETNRLFGDLLTTAPQLEAVQREYMNALEGFDREVYFFSPTQRPFEPSRFERAEYLDRFVQMVPDSPLSRQASLNLFLLRIEMGSYSRARELLKSALTSGPEESRPEGILEVFRNYLETPEPQPWINQAMPEVFLHGDVRPLLLQVVTEPSDRFLMGVAATKMALLQDRPDDARREADGAMAEWNRIPPEEITADLNGTYGRLLVMRAREAELRRLYAEAAAGYGVAADYLETSRADQFELQEEIRYRAALLQMLLSDYPDALEKLRETETRSGCELVNPSWEPEALRAAVRSYGSLYRETTTTLKQWGAYEAGVAMAKLGCNAQARFAFREAIDHSGQDFLRKKALLELANLDELEHDPWNAARDFARLAAMPDTSADTRLWCSYQIARLHLGMGYKVSAAREALALIVSNRPDTPLATQAQELLVSTSTR